VSDPRVEGIELLVPPGREKEESGNEVGAAAIERPSGQASESGGEAPAKSAAEEMRGKLQTPEGREVYNRRKAIVEPVFGQIKEARGLRGF
jgi:hypothetical protein